MFCQSCGAKNTDDARFCNMCGISLAKAGEAGGPIEDASDTLKSDGSPLVTPGPQPNPSAGFNDTSMLGVSLAGIGVRSNKKTWAVLGAIAVALVAAGALASYLARGEPVDGHAEADDPFVIGSPLPEEDGTVDAVTTEASEEPPLGAPTPAATNTSGRPRTNMRSTRMSSRTRSSMGTSTTGMSSAGGTNTGSTGVGGTSGGTSNAGMGGPSGGTDNGSEMGGTGAGGTGGTSISGGTSTMGSAGSMSGSSMGSSPGDPIDELLPERDLAMELYSSRVRFLIRRYYGSRAQTCFDRATRNNPSVSGTVVIAMNVGADGQVTRTRVARNSTGNEALGNCLSSQVSSWRLSAPPNGPVEMQIPFSR